MKKPALFIAGLALSASALTACGGGAPTDASVEDFCAGFENFGSDAPDPTSEDFDPGEFVEIIKEETEGLVDTGTPEDIPDDARTGFEVSTQALLDLEDDISVEDLEDLDSELSDDDKEAADAFDDYLDETCDA